MLKELLRGSAARFLLSLVGVAALGATLAVAAGLYTNGVPPVYVPGTTGNQSVNGVSIGTGYTTLPLTGLELIPADTQLSGGRAPQTEAISVSQLRLFTVTPVGLTSAASLAIDASLSDMYTLTLSSNSSLATPSNLQAGKAFRLRFTQDTVGSRVLTTASVPIWKWNGLSSGAVLTTTANATDLINCAYDGIFILCTPQRDFLNNQGRQLQP